MNYQFFLFNTFLVPHPPPHKRTEKNYYEFTLTLTIRSSLTPSSQAQGKRERLIFASWSILVAVVSVGLGVFIGTSLTEQGKLSISGEISQATVTSRQVNTLDLRQILEDAEDRRRLTGDSQLDHDTKYYDSIHSVTVRKANNYAYNFVVNSWAVLTDGSLEFSSSGKEVLSYRGGEWKLETEEDKMREDSNGSDDSDDSGGGGTRKLRTTDYVPRAMDSRRKLSSKSSLCKSTIDSPCKTCIETQDSWCAGSAWDSFCTAGCDGATKYMATGCADECKEPEIVEVSAKSEAEEEKETPVDCVVSAWNEYPANGESCDFLTGNLKCFSKNTRTVTTEPKHGGDSCPALTTSVECNCPAVMGDGKRVSPEVCDDGNTESGDGCNAQGTAVETGWTCTGGSAKSPDVCLATRCGDGIRAGIEECDDGNNENYDGCSSDCKVENDAFFCQGGIGEQSQCECMRVRKDWNMLRPEERALYIEAVNDLKSSGVYDLLVQTHAHLDNKEYAHGTSGFLPWHRKYLLEYENALRAQNEKYACVTVPYWDWAEDTDVCKAKGGCKTFHEESSILQAFGGPGSMHCMTHRHSGSKVVPDTAETRSLGCNGKTTSGSTGAKARTCAPHEIEEGCVPIEDRAIGCVTSGPFAGWNSPLYEDDTTYCLTRGVNWDIATQGYLTGSQRLQEIITSNNNYGSRSGFRAYIESTPHANPHNLLGGHIRSFSSPSDPLFWSHHAMIDKIWAQWQNCHDHDEVRVSDVSRKEYQPTKSGLDGFENFMSFDFPALPGGGAEESKCYKDNASNDCSVCVGENDSWCNSNDWDSQCEKGCTSSACSTRCASSSGSNSVRSPKDVMSGWDSTKTTPKDYHSIHDLGTDTRAGNKPNSYMYAADAFDISLSKKDAVCNQIETAHHGQQWKNRRGLNGMSKKLVDPNLGPDGKYVKNVYEKLRDMYERHGEPMHHRMLEVSTDKYGCVRDVTAGWSSTVQINPDTKEPWCGTDEAGNFCYCVCEEGMIWSTDETYCHPTHWDEVEPDPLVVAVNNYFDILTDKLIAESIYVKDSDSLLDALPQLVKRECELLYNKKINNTMIDEIKDPNSLKSRFLGGWGLQAEVGLGAADDPCDGIGFGGV